MKYLCVLLVAAAALAAPVDEESTTVGIVPPPKDMARKVTTKPPDFVEILESGSDHKSDGSYSFHYRGADGSFREETAVVKDAGTDHAYLEITGAYSYFDSEGKEVVVHYKAGDHGFVPEGNSIPEAISTAAKTNSELPSPMAVASDDVDADDDDDMDDAATVLKMPKKH